jgi:ribosomal protein S18 acetylase RimI-like enzyme
VPTQNPWTIRPALTADRTLVSSLLAASSWKHQHLDWFSALELIGIPPYYLALEGPRAIGCLACPPDVPEVDWLRLFVVQTGHSVESVWDPLWEVVREAARLSGATVAAALPTAEWMPALLERAGFERVNEVVFLEWDASPPPVDRPAPARVRPFRPREIAAVAEIDHRAFHPLWQLSDRSLEAALAQAAVATVAEVDGNIVGYQITTATGVGAHLARLAVDPPLQRSGIGSLLVTDALRYLSRRGLHRVSVNTQADNAPSLRLYSSLAFAPSGQSFPVYTFPL